MIREAGQQPEPRSGQKAQVCKGRHSLPRAMKPLDSMKKLRSIGDLQGRSAVNTSRHPLRRSQCCRCRIAYRRSGGGRADTRRFTWSFGSWSENVQTEVKQEGVRASNKGKALGKCTVSFIGLTTPEAVRRRTRQALVTVCPFRKHSQTVNLAAEPSHARRIDLQPVEHLQAHRGEFPQRLSPFAVASSVPLCDFDRRVHRMSAHPQAADLLTLLTQHKRGSTLSENVASAWAGSTQRASNTAAE